MYAVRWEWFSTKMSPLRGWALRLMSAFYEDATPTGLFFSFGMVFYEDATPTGLFCSFGMAFYEDAISLGLGCALSWLKPEGVAVAHSPTLKHGVKTMPATF
ncbi:MAG: hypothetical protein J0L94_08330 [Rhodothermia bacterium]|nr:hypothetical protein [Rhodothermia bacterium]